MPFVNVKLVKNQVSDGKKKEFILGLTDLIVTVMGRDRSLTVITADELEASAWAIGGATLDEQKAEPVVFVNIKVSKGTTSPEEMNSVIAAVKALTIKIFGGSALPNYVIIDELSPDGWGFDGISMTERRKLEQ
jgi:4-oxalocrotonate tautomerase